MLPTHEHPTPEDKDQLTEGSFPAIERAEKGETQQTETEKVPSEDKKTITDIQEAQQAESKEDKSREEGPYGVQEEGY